MFLSDAVWKKDYILKTKNFQLQKAYSKLFGNDKTLKTNQSPTAKKDVPIRCRVEKRLYIQNQKLPTAKSIFEVIWK